VVRVLGLVKVRRIIATFVEQMVVCSVQATIPVGIRAIVHYINTFSIANFALIGFDISS